jgi:predicted nucleotidyltransferase
MGVTPGEYQRGTSLRVVSGAPAKSKWYASLVMAVAPSPAVSDAVARFARAVRARFGERVTDLALFGSHARGDATEESDVDVLVAIDELSHEERLEVLRIAYEIDRSADDWVGLSPLVYSTTETTRMRRGGRRLFREIDAQGIRL